jgi:hypothetical protein
MADEPASESGPGAVEQRGDAPAGQPKHDRALTILEAALLAAVALLAAWSGYASAKWSTQSRLELASASSARIQGNRAAGEDAETLAFDTSSFAAWFTAYVAGNQAAMDVAARRFRPQFRVAFDAWIAEDPFTNSAAPPGPTYMPQYARPERDHAKALDVRAAEQFEKGAKAADNADRYVRITVFLATVLFLVGISGHFRVRAARLGLIVLSVGILIVAITLLVITPKPPF